MRYTENQKQKFSIRKLSIGAASVLLGTTLVILGGVEPVKADIIGSEQVSQQNNDSTSSSDVNSLKQRSEEAQAAVKAQQNKIQ